MTSLKPFKRCRKLNLPLWECPTFLFILMGFVTIAAMLSTYFIARLYAGPEFVIIAVTLTTLISFIIGHFAVQSVDRLVKISQMKTEFVSIASHQLRTPLSVLKWSLEELRQNNLNNKQEEYVQMIEENNQRMVQLVNTLLNVTRIEQGRFSLNLQKINLVDLINKSLREFLTLAQSRNIEINFSKPKSSVPVKVDPQKFSMAINNLLSNAIQYIKGQGRINIKLTNTPEKVVLKIEDNGVGIPEDAQEKIFEKFFRAKNAKRYQTQGSGLGLYITKAITEAHQGKIWFESKENKGTTFWISLPTKS